MSRKLLLILSALFICAFSNLKASVKIGELYYNVDKRSKTAEVTCKSLRKNSPANQDWSIMYADIPTEISYKGEIYKVKSVSDYAFYGCDKLISVSLPDDIERIGQYAFAGCRTLSTITLPVELRDIDVAAFMGCESIREIIIPENVQRISLDAFKGCEKLAKVTLLSNFITSKAYNDKSGLNEMFGEQVEVYNLGNGIIQIGAHAFSNCKSIKYFDIPPSVREIGDFAFSHCSNLEHIKISMNVKKIQDYTFYSCANLRSIEISEGVEYIGFNSFAYCGKLSEVFIPNSVKKIDSWAFGYCKGLKSVTLGIGLESISSSSFGGCKDIMEITYPKGLNIKSSDYPSYTKLIAYNRSNVPHPKEKNPPLIVLQEGSVILTDATNDNTIDAEESCIIKFMVQNVGKGNAYNCIAKTKIEGTKKGINVENVKLPTISSGQSYEVIIPVNTNINTQDGQVTFSIEVYEPNGWGVAPFELSVATKAYEPPLLQVVDYSLTSASGEIRKMEPFTLSFNLQNTKYGEAKDVQVKIDLPSNVFLMDGSASFNFPIIRSGEAKNIQITLAANNNYSISSIPIGIEVKEKYGRFAENKNLDIALNQTTSSSISITASKDVNEERQEIRLAMLKSDVDRNIPATNTKSPNTFVLIIANEHYSQVATVPFALNDGNIFREYCIKTLGIGEKHIKYLTDATGNQIKAGVNWLANLTEAFDEPQIIVYYAGHGIPDETNKSAYLLPVDGIISDMSTCYKLDNLYATLGNMPASQIAVFMDACFSGSKREDGMLASARGVALKAKSGVPKGNMVVFSAAQGDETAYPNREQQHGLFTYYLLKKIQETEGNVALKELGDYVTKQVTQQSLLLNSKKQTPCVTPSASVETEWQSWKLK